MFAPLGPSRSEVERKRQETSRLRAENRAERKREHDELIEQVCKLIEDDDLDGVQELLPSQVDPSTTLEVFVYF